MDSRFSFISVKEKLSEEMIARDKADIDSTQWLLPDEITEKAKSLGLHEKVVKHNFTFPLEKIKNYTSYSAYPVRAWAQEIFQNQLFIGNSGAMILHYDTSSTYTHFKHEVIVDLSQDASDYVEINDKNNFQHFEINISDTGDNFLDLVKILNEKEIFDKINRARKENKKVLINCSQGMSRSATVAILYLMETYQIGFAQAYFYLQAKRPIVMPNPGYVAGLIAYEKARELDSMQLKDITHWLNNYQEQNTFLHSFNITKDKDGKFTFLKLGLATNNMNHNLFINTVCFLKALDIPFTLIECSNIGGSIQLAKNDFNQFEIILKSILPIDQQIKQSKLKDNLPKLLQPLKDILENKIKSKAKEKKYTLLKLFIDEIEKDCANNSFDLTSSFGKLAIAYSLIKKYLRRQLTRAQLTTEVENLGTLGTLLDNAKVIGGKSVLPGAASLNEWDGTLVNALLNLSKEIQKIYPQAIAEVNAGYDAVTTATTTASTITTTTTFTLSKVFSTLSPSSTTSGDDESKAVEEICNSSMHKKLGKFCEQQHSDSSNNNENDAIMHANLYDVYWEIPKTKTLSALRDLLYKYNFGYYTRPNTNNFLTSTPNPIKWKNTLIKQVESKMQSMGYDVSSPPSSTVHNDSNTTRDDDNITTTTALPNIGEKKAVQEYISKSSTFSKLCEFSLEQDDIDFNDPNHTVVENFENLQAIKTATSFNEVINLLDKFNFNYYTKPSSLFNSTPYPITLCKDLKNKVTAKMQFLGYGAQNKNNM